MGIEEKLPSGILLTSVEKLSNYARKSSFWGATFGLACCAIEMMAAGGPHYDLGRWGMEVFRASPRQADLMIVAGRVSQKMAPVLRQIYDQMPEPRSVIAMGVCASSGGMFNNYAIVQGVDHVVPVDMYLPGCPPRPEMLIDSILKLREKILHQPLGPNGRKMLEARKARGDVPAVPYGAMPSSYRENKARAAEWEKAVIEGREEQLRIENWMKAQKHLTGLPKRGQA
jgi:NADH-quinone oxidoreductase subunit B